MLLVYFDNRDVIKENHSACSYWFMIGGKIEDGEDYVSAVKREIFEETSITADKLEIGPIVFKGKMIFQY